MRFATRFLPLVLGAFAAVTIAAASTGSTPEVLSTAVMNGVTGCTQDVECELHGCPGNRECLPNGQLGPCMCAAAGGEQVSCTRCGVATTGVCSYTCDVTCNGTVADQPCNPNSCTNGGMQSCQANGQWSECSGCSGTCSCQTQCSTTGSGTSSGNSCSIPVQSCTAAEQCNQCDDDLNGTIDDGISCQPCQL